MCTVVRTQAVRKETFCLEYSVIDSSRSSGVAIIDLLIRVNDCSRAAITRRLLDESPELLRQRVF